VSDTTLEEAIKLNHAVDIRDHLDELSPEWAELIRAKIAQHEAAVELRHTLEAMKATLTRNRFGFYALGMGVGSLTAYLVTKRLLQTKYQQIADDEIAEMKAHYQAKSRALEAEYAKRPVEDIVKERGYSSPDVRTDVAPPMAVQPPATVTEDEVDTPEKRQKVVDDLDEAETRVKNVFEEAQVDYEWDWHKERSRRTPDKPYVVHYDERLEMEYEDVTLTYYEQDDVLCDERDNPVDPDERDSIVGEANLNRFGHGSNDASVVYIRNDRLEILYEVVKSPNAFVEEVHGIKHDSGFGRNVERMRVRERDDPEA